MWLLQRIIYLTLLFVIFVYGTYHFKKMNMPFKYLVILVATTFIFETLAVVLALTIKNTLLVYEIFSFIQVSLFCIIYYKLFTLQLYKKFIPFLFVCIILVFLYELLFLSLAESDVNIISRSLLYIILALFLFRDWLLKPGNLNITQTPAFWMNAGMLFFFTVNILFWSIYSTKFFTEYKLSKVFGYLLYFSNLIFYSLIFLALNYEVKLNRNGQIGR